MGMLCGSMKENAQFSEEIRKWWRRHPGKSFSHWAFIVGWFFLFLNISFPFYWQNCFNSNSVDIVMVDSVMFIFIIKNSPLDLSQYFSTWHVREFLGKKGGVLLEERVGCIAHCDFHRFLGNRGPARVCSHMECPGSSVGESFIKLILKFLNLSCHKETSGAWFLEIPWFISTISGTSPSHFDMCLV